MAMDGLNLYASVCEIKALIGGRIEKIQQPEKDALILSVRNNGENYKLLLCASPNQCRAQLTGVKRANPMDAPVFCMLLRKRLTGGRILSVEQRGMDRIFFLGVEAKNDLGDTVTYKLCTEIMGKHSNVILMDENDVVVDAIRRVGIGMSKVRIVVPGVPYQLPPQQEKENPLHASKEDFARALMTGARIDKTLSNTFFGLSPAVAAVLAEQISDKRLIAELTVEDRDRLAAYLHVFYGELAQGVFHPTLVLNEYEEPVAVYPFAPTGVPTQAVGSMWEAFDRYYEDHEAQERQRRQSASIRRVIQNNIERCEKKLALYQGAIEAEDEIARLRLFGELITASLRELRPGMSGAALLNYYLDPPQKVEVPLDPRYSPSENAQRYYKKYQKAKAAREMARSQRQQTQEELSYLEGQLDNLDKCTADGEIRELEEELRQEGYIRREKSKSKPQKLPASKPLCFVSCDGVEICVGKNNRQNDELTLRIAEPDHIWMHTKEIPGSHVIVKSAQPPNSTLYQAALLAAWYSKARGGAQVPVDYTPRKYVRKPSGAKPGMVIYTTNKTAYVTPEESEVKKIRQK